MSSARRGNGEGSIRLRADGRWEATLTLPSQGAKRRRSSYFGKTRAEAARKLTAALKLRDDGISVPSNKLTVESHLLAWLETKRTNLRPETWRRYNDLCTRYLIPEIGGVKLAQLTIDHIKNLHIALAKTLSGTSCQHAHAVLHTALQDALRWDLVTRNVASLVSAPRRDTGEMKYLGPDDARDLLEAAKGTELEALFVLALTGGLRSGELQALRWKDVDLRRHRLRVTATLTTVKDGAPVFGEPKTQHSRRTVWLSEKALGVLERHRITQDAQRRLAGPAWHEYGLVFCTEVGKPLWRSRIRLAFKKLLTAAGLPDLRVHDLRHTAATLLLEQGVPVKVASEALGHSDITTTLRIYAHVVDGAQEQAANAMDRLFNA